MDMKKVAVELHTLSHIGNKRENNEDNFFANGTYMSLADADRGHYARESFTQNRHVIAVCDGMGGEERGEEAASIAVETLSKHYKEIANNNKKNVYRMVMNYACEANDNMNSVVGDKGGTTLAVLTLDSKGAFVANLGDSRAYHLSARKLKLLTKDHTQAQMLYETGLIDERELRVHPDRNKLSNYLGVDRRFFELSPHISQTKNVIPGDMFLICSDGLTDLVSEETIEAVLLKGLASPLQELLRLALAAGGTDNITMVLVKVLWEQPEQMGVKRIWDGYFKIIAIVVVLAVIVSLFGLILGYFYSAGKNNNSTIGTQTATDKTNSENTNGGKVDNAVMSDSFRDLSNKLMPYVVQKDRRVSYYVKDLKSGDSITVNDDRLIGEGLLRLYVMAAIYQGADRGTISLNERTQKMIENMITIGSNEDTNELVKILGNGNYTGGMKAVNDNALSLGFFKTKQQHDLQAYRDLSNAGENYTSVSDCGKLLEMIYNKKLVSEEFSEQAMVYLENQQRRNKLPATLPEDAIIANSTGESQKAENDAAIISNMNNKRYVVCIMTNKAGAAAYADSEKKKAIEDIAVMSKIIYDYLNK